MGAHNYEELKRHIGHDIVCTYYGPDAEDPVNVAIECEECNEVLLDYDREEDEGDGINTPMGKLTSSEITDSCYPGINIRLDGQLVATVEYDSITKAIRTINYKSTQDEYSSITVYKKEE